MNPQPASHSSPAAPAGKPVRSVAIYCPDTNIPLSLQALGSKAVRGGKAAILQTAKALARKGAEVTVFGAAVEPGIADGVTLLPLEACAGFHDVAIFTTGAEGHFRQPAAQRLEAHIRVFWVSGPVKVEPPPGPIHWIVAPAAFIAERGVRQWGFPAPNTVVIRGEAVPARLETAALLTRERNPLRGVFLSHPAKGLDSILAVLQRLREKGFPVELDVYGSVAFWQEEPSLLRSSPSWVQLRGELPQQDTVRFLSQYGFMPYFVRWEDGYSLATAEAMAAGVVVFVSAHGSNREFVADGFTGIHVPMLGAEPDTGAAERALERYFRNPEAYEPMRLASARAVATWDERANEWLELFSREHVPAAWRPGDEEITVFAPSCGEKRLVLVGDFGAANIGDDAIMEAWIAHLPQLAPDASVTILAPREFPPPGSVKNVVDWHGWESALQVIAESSTVLVAGGGLFHEWWALSRERFLTPSLEGPTAYLSIVAAAKAFGKRCFCCGVGVGPLATAPGKALVAEVLAEADLITLRDSHSLQLLQSLGVPGGKLRHTADTAFALPHRWPPESQLWAQLLGFVPPEPRVAVVLRGWDVFDAGDQFAGRLAAALEELQHAAGGSILFLPFQRDQGHPWTNDAAAAWRVLRRLRPQDNAFLLPLLTPSLADAVIAHSQLVIAMRFHAVVMAFRSLVPAVGLAYDPKVAALFHDAGLAAWCLPLSSWRPEELAVKATTLLTHRDLQKDGQLAYRNRAHRELSWQFSQLQALLRDEHQSPVLSAKARAWREQLKQFFPSFFARLSPPVQKLESVEV
jgi:polysaccharide pyruvyl transferase CsaB